MVRLPGWGGNGMSVTSKLTTIAAAGGGSDPGWGLEIAPTGSFSGGAGLKAVIQKSDGTFVATGNMDNGQGAGTIAFDAAGALSSMHRLTDGAGASSVAIHASTLFEDDVNNDVWLGGYWYTNSQAPGEAAWYGKTDDGDPLQSVSGFYGPNSRGGDMSIAYYPAGQSIFTAFSGYDGSRLTGQVQKFNLQGTRQWPYSINWNQNNSIRYAHWETNSLRPGYGGNFLVGMTTAINQSVGHYAHDLAVIDENGSLQAVYRSTSSTTNSGSGEGQSIASDTSFIYDCGYAEDTSLGNGHNNMHIRKINKATGALVWERFYLNKIGSTYYQSEGRAIAVDSDGNVYATSNHGGGNSHDVVWKFNSSGTLQWAIRIGKTSYESILDALTVGSDGFIYAGGFTRSSTGNNNILMLKIPPDGISAGTYGDYEVSIPSYGQATGFLTYSDNGGSLGTGGAFNKTLTQYDDAVSTSATLTQL